MKIHKELIICKVRFRKIRKVLFACATCKLYHFPRRLDATETKKFQDVGAGEGWSHGPDQAWCSRLPCGVKRTIPEFDKKGNQLADKAIN